MTTARAIDVITIGESMGLLVGEEIGPLASSPTMRLHVAGSESNVAIALTRLGHSSAWMSKVGNDGIGDLVTQTIRAQGVGVHVNRDESRPTGLMIKELRTPMHQRVTYYRASSAAAHMQPSDLNEDLIKRARWLHVTGISLAVSAQMRSTIYRAIAVAREFGTLVSLDLNYRSGLWSRSSAQQEYETILALSDLVFANVEEAEIAVGYRGSPESLSGALAELGPVEVVIKQGANGALGYRSDEVASVDALRIPVVDTVGAGDAFVAGYISAALHKSTMIERLKLGTLVAAFVCMSRGDWEGSPSLDELGLLDSDDVVTR